MSAFSNLDPFDAQAALATRGTAIEGEVKAIQQGARNAHRGLTQAEQERIAALGAERVSLTKDYEAHLERIMPGWLKSWAQKQTADENALEQQILTGLRDLFRLCRQRGELMNRRFYSQRLHGKEAPGLSVQDRAFWRALPLQVFGKVIAIANAGSLAGSIFEAAVAFAKNNDLESMGLPEGKGKK